MGKRVGIVDYAKNGSANTYSIVARFKGSNCNIFEMKVFAISETFAESGNE